MKAMNPTKIIINKEEEKVLRDVRELATQICHAFYACSKGCPFYTVEDSRCLTDLAGVAIERLENKVNWEVDEE